MDFKLPDIGEGVHEGEIVRWLVKDGDSFAVDQPIVEIMTDKATVEIPSSVAGKVTKLLSKEGDMAKVGQTIMSYEQGAGATATAKPAAASIPASKPVPAPAAAKPAAPAPRPQAAAAPTRQAAPAPNTPAQAQSYVAEPGRVLATPATRRLARDLSIDLTKVPATGPHGRVTKEDVQKFTGATAAGPAMPVHARATYVPTQGMGERETLVPFRGIRRKIAEAMSRSRTVIPEFTYVDEIDMTELVALRKDAKETAEALGVKLTYLPFIIKALIQGLKRYPTMNASLDEQGGNVVLKNYFNIGIAVDTDQGLVVPVVKDADRKSILQIAAEITELADKARKGKLALEDMQGATITITNPGPIGGLITAPVINWPEVAIVGIHKIVRRPVVKTINGKEEITIADMMYVSLAVDHRVVDGASAARFCNVLIDYLSNPKKLMLEMA
jgi:pyruvate dehydrogenase E2 component (dihydrolipoamide acetyltransferase)